MTDKEKLGKLAAYLVRRMYAHNQMADIGSTGEIFDEKIENAKYEECRDTLNFIDSMQEEPQVKESAKIQHVNKTCKENSDSLTQELASEGLESFVRNYREKYWYPDDIDKFIGFAKQVANWQKQQLMAKAVDATVHIDAGGYPYIPQMELYDYEKDIPLAKEGYKYKVILIKED